MDKMKTHCINNYPLYNLLGSSVSRFGHACNLLIQGFDGEEVSDRNLAKSIGCSKNFRGPDCLDTKEKVRSRNTYVCFQDPGG